MVPGSKNLLGVRQVLLEFKNLVIHKNPVMNHKNRTTEAPDITRHQQIILRGQNGKIVVFQNLTKMISILVMIV